MGVLGIDSLLFAQGFRAYENVFSLITQVVGRSGRGEKHGRAVIQAYVLIMAVLFVVGSVLVDILSAAVDPRLRKEF